MGGTAALLSSPLQDLIILDYTENIVGEGVVILVCVSRPWEFSTGTYVAFLFVSPNRFLGEVLNRGVVLEKKMVRLYRIRRPYHVASTVSIHGSMRVDDGRKC